MKTDKTAAINAWIVVTVVLMLILLLAGSYAVSKARHEEVGIVERMQLVERTDAYTIYCDTYTRILYIKGAGGAFTVMLDRQGYPMILPEKTDDTGVKVSEGEMSMSGEMNYGVGYAEGWNYGYEEGYTNGLKEARKND